MNFLELEIANDLWIVAGFIVLMVLFHWNATRGDKEMIDTADRLLRRDKN